MKFFIWDDPYFFKYYSDQVFRRCIPDNEVRSVLLFIMTRHVRGTLVVGKLQLKFFNVVSSGLFCLGMLLSIVRVALGANSWVESAGGI